MHFLYSMQSFMKGLLVSSKHTALTRIFYEFFSTSLVIISALSFQSAEYLRFKRIAWKWTEMFKNGNNLKIIYKKTHSPFINKALREKNTGDCWFKQQKVSIY